MRKPLPRPIVRSLLAVPTQPPTSRRTSHWRLPTGTLRFGRLPLLMGVVNVTPDSFSDGGQFFDPQAAIDHALQMAADGADILDIGGQSTRPGSAPVDAGEELRRVVPVVAGLCEQTDIPISIDTSKAVVAREAVAAGARIINDVTALSEDPGMLQVAVDTEAAVCAMHIQGTPRSMQEKPQYDDVTEDVLSYLRDRRDALVAGGISADRIALDPGIGFGKTVDHNLQLLCQIARFHELGCPVLVGHSRKSFIGKVLADDKAERLSGTIAVTLTLARAGVQIVRVHDVAPVRRALMLFEASGGLS